MKSYKFLLMKKILLFITLSLNYSVSGQDNIDSNSFEYKCKYKYKVDFKIDENYYQIDHHRAFIPTYTSWSCMPYFFKEALVNKKYENHYVIYFDFNETASSKDTNNFIAKYVNPDFDFNTNYLGGMNCKIERDRYLMKVYESKDFIKFNADTILCLRVDSNARKKNDPNLNDFIYIIMHKQNVGDIYIGFAYKKEYEFEVLDEIKNLWKLIKFN